MKSLKHDKTLESRVLLDIEELASSLANGYADDQSLFLNTFFKALKRNCEDSYRNDLQLTHINNELNSEAAYAVTFMGGGVDEN